MAEDPEKHVSTDGGDDGAPTHHHHHHGHERHGHEGPDSGAATAAVKDPVCGMDVDPAKTPHKSNHEGHEYFFCSAGCRAKFQKEPSRYTPSAPRPMPAAPVGTIYTCPMHPQIRQVGPGS